MLRRGVLLLSVLLIFSFGFVSASNGCNMGDVECGSVPTNNCDVTKDTVFDAGTYNLPEGVDICEDGIVLDCGEATLIGEGNYSNGIQNTFSDDVVIRNCNLQNFYAGITLSTGSCGAAEFNTIEFNEVSDSEFGITAILIGGACSKNTSHIIKDNYFDVSDKGLWFSYTSQNIIEDNVITSGVGFYGGIQMFNSDNNEIRNNSISSGLVGIVASGIDNLVEDNFVSLTEIGISFSSDGNGLIRNNVVFDNEDGIKVHGDSSVIGNLLDSNEGDGVFMNGDFNLVENNTFVSNDRGVFGYFANYNNVENNVFESNDYGIKIWEVSINNNLSENQFYSNGVGVSLDFGASFNEITDSEFESNNIGVEIEDFSNFNLISGNDFITNVQGITVTESSDNIFDNNNLNSNNPGVRLQNSPRTHIKNNIISSGSEGIRILSSHASIVESNDITSNEDGGIFLLCTGCVVDNNVIEENGPYGILLNRNFNNNFSNNFIYSNEVGIKFDQTSTPITSNAIFNNDINSNGVGIHFNGEDIRFNKVLSNNIRLNALAGIIINLAHNNSVYNNIFNNSQNAFDNRVNYWNSTKDCSQTNIIGGPCIGGNSWNDYLGVDLDGDGLGDTNLPYNSNGGIANVGDYLPLVTPAKGCLGDVDGNGVVDVRDLVIVILHWGTDDATADLNGDGIVDVLDLVEIILNWGVCGNSEAAASYYDKNNFTRADEKALENILRDKLPEEADDVLISLKQKKLI